MTHPYYPYIYCCPYLWWLLHREKLLGQQLQERIVDIERWLNANLKGMYVWYPAATNESEALYHAVYFKEESDLVAFRLRWGINA